MLCKNCTAVFVHFRYCIITSPLSLSPPLSSLLLSSPLFPLLSSPSFSSVSPLSPSPLPLPSPPSLFPFPLPFPLSTLLPFPLLPSLSTFPLPLPLPLLPLPLPSPPLSSPPNPSRPPLPPPLSTPPFSSPPLSSPLSTLPGTRSTQWEDPRLIKIQKRVAAAVPYSRDYKAKYEHFRKQLLSRRPVSSNLDLFKALPKWEENRWCTCHNKCDIKNFKSCRMIPELKKYNHTYLYLWLVSSLILIQPSCASVFLRVYKCIIIIFQWTGWMYMCMLYQELTNRSS